MHALEGVNHTVQNEEEIPPANQFAIPFQAQRTAVPPMRKQLVDIPLVGNFLERLLRVADRKRNQNRARPRRDLVDVEPEPVGKQHNLGRNCRDRIVIVLPKGAEIDLAEGIAGGHAAHGEDALAGARHALIVRRIAAHFQRKIRFHAGRDVRRATLVNRPTAVLILMTQNFVCTLLKAALVASAENGVQKNIIGFQRSVGFQFAAPPAIFVLPGKQELPAPPESNY